MAMKSRISFMVRVYDKDPGATQAPCIPGVHPTHGPLRQLTYRGFIRPRGHSGTLHTGGSSDPWATQAPCIPGVHPTHGPLRQLTYRGFIRPRGHSGTLHTGGSSDPWATQAPCIPAVHARKSSQGHHETAL